MRFTLAAVVCVLALVRLMGCVAVPVVDPESRPASHALADPGRTPLGQLLARHAPDTGEASGFGVLSSGRDALVALHDLLASANRHFGYRVACEIARFVRLAVEQAADDDASAEAAARASLDLAVLQKVLVKLAGTQAEIARLLDDLLWFTLLGRRTADTERDLGLWRLDAVEGEVVPSDEASEEVPVFPRSAAKLWRMRSRLLERGFTSWIE